MMNEFVFVNDINEYRCHNAHVAVIGSVHTKEQLLNQIAEKCSFPDYFGHNWDALDECLKDFHWIAVDEIILYHRALPDLPRKELLIYLDILASAVTESQNYPVLKFTVIFGTSEKKAIEKMTYFTRPRL
jgi:hypothetical protein